MGLETRPLKGGLNQVSGLEVGVLNRWRRSISRTSTPLSRSFHSFSVRTGMSSPLSESDELELEDDDLDLLLFLLFFLLFLERDIRPEISFLASSSESESDFLRLFFFFFLALLLLFSASGSTSWSASLLEDDELDDEDWSLDFFFPFLCLLEEGGGEAPRLELFLPEMAELSGLAEAFFLSFLGFPTTTTESSWLWPLVPVGLGSLEAGVEAVRGSWRLLLEDLDFFFGFSTASRLCLSSCSSLSLALAAASSKGSTSSWALSPCPSPDCSVSELEFVSEPDVVARVSWRPVYHIK